jgi:hypothetical protein
MSDQEEMTALRDIIRHDVMMDAKALEKLAEVKVLITDIVSIDDTEKRAAVNRMRLLEDNRLANLITLLDEIEKCIQSTLAEAGKNAGVVNSIQVVLADRPE